MGSASSYVSFKARGIVLRAATVNARVVYNGPGVQVTLTDIATFLEERKALGYNIVALEQVGRFPQGVWAWFSSRGGGEGVCGFRGDDFQDFPGMVQRHKVRAHEACS